MAESTPAGATPAEAKPAAPAAAKPAAPAAATAPAAAKPAAPAAPAPPPRDMRTEVIKGLFAQIQAEQRRLGWSDAKLVEFANATLGPLDAYKRLKVTTLEFLSRIRPTLLETLLAAMKKAG